MRTIYTFYADAARIALQSIFAHKLRAFLTLIGIIIGVASVVVVGAAISGLNTYVMEKVTAILGTNHFMIARMARHGNVSEEEWERIAREPAAKPSAVTLETLATPSFLSSATFFSRYSFASSRTSAINSS